MLFISLCLAGAALVIIGFAVGYSSGKSQRRANKMVARQEELIESIKHTAYENMALGAENNTNLATIVVDEINKYERQAR